LSELNSKHDLLIHVLVSKTGLL